MFHKARTRSAKDLVLQSDGHIRLEIVAIGKRQKVVSMRSRFSRKMKDTNLLGTLEDVPGSASARCVTVPELERRLTCKLEGSLILLPSTKASVPVQIRGTSNDVRNQAGCLKADHRAWFEVYLES